MKYIFCVYFLLFLISCLYSWDNCHFMLRLLLVSLSSVDLITFSKHNFHYHNSASIPLSCILDLNFYPPVTTLTLDIALFEYRSDCKNASKFSYRIIWVKVGWIFQVKILESTAYAAICYPSQKLLCLDTWEFISLKIKVF